MLDDEHDVVARRELAEHRVQRRDVARMQADRGLVEHEQRAHERRAERGRERHALRLAAGERARLAIEREVAEADALEVRKPAFELASRDLALTGRRAQLLREFSRLADLERVPVGEAPCADPIRKGCGIQAFSAAHAARIVGAVAREQDADVHLVRLRLEPAEPAEHARELPLVPAAVALEHDGALLRLQLRPRHVQRNAVALAELLELAALPGRRLPAPRTHRALRERSRRIWNDFSDVDAERATEATAFGAGTDRRLVREQARARRFERLRAARAAEPLPHRDALALGVRAHEARRTLPARLDPLREATRIAPGNQPIHHDLEPAAGEGARWGERIEVDDLPALVRAPKAVSDEAVAKLEVALGVRNGHRVRHDRLPVAEHRGNSLRSRLRVEPRSLDAVIRANGARFA